MANYLVFGSGNIGPAIIRFLIEDPETEKVHVIDKNEERLQTLIQKFRGHSEVTKIKSFFLSSDDPEIIRLLSGIDMIITAMPWKPTFELIKNTRYLNIPLVSITRPNYDDLESLYSMVSSSSSSVIVGCGLEPGLTEILANHCISIFPDTIKLNIYCGGITTVPNPPVFYKQVFGDELPISERKAYQFKDSKLIFVDRFSGIEKITLDEIGTLEAWNDGMAPWLIKNINSEMVTEINQKTLRWHGFSNMISLLRQLGFTRKKPIVLNGNQEIEPYQLTQFLLREHVYFDHSKDRDMVILHIQGETNNRKIYKVTLKGTYDTQFGLSAMASTTGYTTAITAKTLLNKKSLGLIHPEQLFKGENYPILIRELYQRGIQLTHFK